ncbi:hypothetical protein, partial [Atlantibacter hermannii]|uniref:hypothetical protein n=1 Tax=Atlantibacter hermannii TaxID=565 RepID=UPI0028A78763
KNLTQRQAESCQSLRQINLLTNLCTNNTSSISFWAATPDGDAARNFKGRQSIKCDGRHKLRLAAYPLLSLDQKLAPHC